MRRGGEAGPKAPERNRDNETEKKYVFGGDKHTPKRNILSNGGMNLSI